MLNLYDENMNLYKAAAISEPIINGSSRWTSAIKFINKESTIFHFIKGSGSHFYFMYQDKWHRMLRPGIRDDEFASEFIMIK